MNKSTIRFISGLCKDRRVIDIGCLGENISSLCFRHLEYVNQSKAYVGVDINEGWLEIARGRGIKNLYYLNIEDEDEVEDFIGYVGHTFEVAVLSEVIEHVSNIKLFLSGVYKLLDESKDSKLVITTPNKLGIDWVLKSIRNDGYIASSKNHLYWFDHLTLANILSNSDFRVDVIKYDEQPKRGLLEGFAIGKVKDWMGSRLIMVASKKLDQIKQ